MIWNTRLHKFWAQACIWRFCGKIHRDLQHLDRVVNPKCMKKNSPEYDLDAFMYNLFLYEDSSLVIFFINNPILSNPEIVSQYVLTYHKLLSIPTIPVDIVL